jgi:phosphatidylserine/phosphatidylglycerophosphate/cardiolipin synthase-like enzyme
MALDVHEKEGEERRRRSWKRVHGGRSVGRCFPDGAWLGSFNVTENATCNLESAAILYDPEAALALLHEFAAVFAVSEDLDWERDIPTPTLDIGP